MRRQFALALVVSLAFTAAASADEPPADKAPSEETKPAADEPKSDEPAVEPEPEPKPDAPPAKVDAPAEEAPAEEEEEFGEEEDDEDGWDDEPAAPTYPRLEHHGYLRFRADMFGNGHLGTGFHTDGGLTKGTSSIKPPITENFVNNDPNDTSRGDVGEGANDETFLAGANMRFRYQPTFWISESLRIAATFDVLDNLVLGSTPDFDPARPDLPIAAFSGGQAPPSGDFQFQDSIRVKELWGEWKILGAIPLRFGRMKSHWGLGILANSGEKWDDDFGDYNDRVMLALQFYGIYFVGGYDIVSSGPTHKQPFQPFGQAYDLTETDDVSQGFMGIFQRPLNPVEVDARADLLNKDRKWGIDWGVYAVFRKQTLDVNQTTLTAIDDGSFAPDTAELIERNAWAIIPDAWLRLEHRPTYSQKIRLELEAAMIVAGIDNVSYNGLEGTGGPREVLSWAVAFEGDYTLNGLNISLHAGAASGDSAKCLAVNDCSNFEQDGEFNTEITNFRFDRNYTVDMIMFREVMGTITNAWYARPAVSYDLFGESDEEALGAELAIILGGALEKSAYPGNSSFLGTEIDVRLYYEQTKKFLADLAFGVYIPGSAFDLKNGFGGYTGSDRSAEVAWTLQTHLVIQF